MAIGEWFRAPVSLAVWFMDDGTLDRRQGSLLFETQSFTRQEIERLQGCLRENFGIGSRIHRSGVGRGLRLYLSVADAQRMAEIVKPFIVDSMRCKLPVPL